MKIKLSLLVASLVLVACDEFSKEELAAYIKRIKARQLPIKETIALPKPIISFSYSETNNARIPFAIKKKAENKYFKNSSNLILNELVLSSLTFVGLIQSSSLCWALIKDPEGRIIHLKKGDYLAKEKVKLTKITQAKLIFKQQIFVDGLWQNKINEMPLNHRNGS